MNVERKIATSKTGSLEYVCPFKHFHVMTFKNDIGIVFSCEDDGNKETLLKASDKYLTSQSETVSLQFSLSTDSVLLNLR